jgi:hypothetical protein
MAGTGSNLQFLSGVVMHQDLPSRPAAHSPSTDWSHGLPGARLTHTLHLVAAPGSDVVARAAACLSNEHVAVRDWAVVRRGGVLEQRIVVDDISEHHAKALSTRLATLADVLRVRVEHCLVRRRGTQAAQPAVA